MDHDNIIVGEIEEMEEMEEIKGIPFLSSRFLKRAGLLFLLSGLVIPMGIITGEIFYPKSRSYTTGGNSIGDLGSALPMSALAAQPLALVFNGAMLLGGIMLLAGAYYYYRFSRNRIIGTSLFLSGLGIIGLGIFPANIPALHPFFYLIAFVFGAIAAIASWWTEDGYIRHVFAALGAISLFFLIFSRILYPFFGTGGTERWVVYPVALWLISFGSYILGKESGKNIFISRTNSQGEK